MDRLIHRTLQRCLARVRDKTPADVATLESDLDLPDVLMLKELSPSGSSLTDSEALVGGALAAITAIKGATRQRR